ncbi:hypothetical protein [Borrelia persica]|uniref:hypothetical protein n=1 Tax=Borrelia persica TaxID=44448 RepID=UPI000464E250|nr:hypothetical protein [Borrelia persica]
MVIFVLNVLFNSCSQDTRKMEDLKTSQQVYAELKSSVQDISDSYYYRDRELNDFLFDAIYNKFDIKYEDKNFKDNVYASLRGDISVVNDLKKIVVDLIDTRDEYEFESYGSYLLDGLNKWGRSIFFLFSQDDVLSNGRLVRLKASHDVSGLEYIKTKLNSIRAKFDELLKLIQNIINNAAISADKYIKTKNFIYKKEILAKLQTFFLSNALFQLCTNEFCRLKNELLILYLQLKNKSYMVIKSILE